MILKYPSWLPFVSILVTVGLAIWLQRATMSQPEAMQTWLASYGWLAILIYIPLQAITLVFAPLSGMALQVAIIGLFGAFWGAIIIFVVTSPIYCINFFIAKKWGRKFLHTLIGEEGMSEVDCYSKSLGMSLLIAFRIQGASYDFVAYAAGVTTITWRQFILVTFLAGIPSALVTFLIYHFSVSLIWGTALVYGFTVVFLAVVIGRMSKQKKMGNKPCR